MEKMEVLGAGTVEIRQHRRLRLPIWVISKASNYKSDAEVLQIAAMS
jgi:hypothetical protein